MRTSQLIQFQSFCGQWLTTKPQREKNAIFKFFVWFNSLEFEWSLCSICSRSPVASQTTCLSVQNDKNNVATCNRFNERFFESSCIFLVSKIDLDQSSMIVCRKKITFILGSMNESNSSDVLRDKKKRSL